MLGKTVCRKHNYKASEKENSVITVWKLHNDRKANNFYLGACVKNSSVAYDHRGFMVYNRSLLFFSPEGEKKKCTT